MTALVPAGDRPRRGRAPGPLPRGTCPVCGNEYALRAGGVLGQHKRRTRQGYRIGDCPGIDRPPAGAPPVEACRAYQVDGQPVVVRGPRPLDQQDQVALTELARAANAHMELHHPHGGVLQELVAATRQAAWCIPDDLIITISGPRQGTDIKARLKAAVQAAREALEATHG